jgi:hypothetical protein
MASSDWNVLVSTNISHSLVDTLGLDMDQNYCWNVRTTLNPAVFAVKNVSPLIGTAGLKTNGDGHTNLKIRALIRKNAVEAIPFLYLRGGATSNTNGYKLAFRASGHLALYKELLDSNFSTTPILVSQNTYSINTTHHIELSTYSQPNGDCFIEAYYGNRDGDPYNPETWTPIFKTMIFYSDNPINQGYCGFGHYGTLIGAYSWFDLFEVYEEQV